MMDIYDARKPHQPAILMGRVYQISIWDNYLSMYLDTGYEVRLDAKEQEQLVTKLQNEGGD